MRVYHFVSADHGLTDIRRQRLKIATLRDINDPFELTICCNDAKRRQVLRSFRNKWAERFGMLCFSRDWRNPVSGVTTPTSTVESVLDSMFQMSCSCQSAIQALPSQRTGAS